MKIQSKRDIKNWVDGCIQNAITPEQLNDAAAEISIKAHTNGLTYGEDWSPLLNTLDIEDLEVMAGL